MNNEDQDTTDPLQPQDQHFSPTQDEVKLPEDNTPPFTPANDVPGAQVPDDHPATDNSVQPEEAYDQGLGNAAGVTEQEVPADTNVKPVELTPQDTPGAPDGTAPQSDAPAADGSQTDQQQ